MTAAALTRSVLLHYHEVALKGGNRGFFERALIRNAHALTADLAPLRFRRLPGRHVADLPAGADVDAIASRLRKVFGVASLSFPVRCDASLQAIVEASIAEIAMAPGDTFAVRAKTASTASGLRGQQLNVEVGTALLEAGAGRVDLDSPDRVVRIEVVGDVAFVAARRVEGPGGLPVGTAGKVVTLLSAGLDSPIAALRLMRRGARAELVHFHSQPYTDASSVRAAIELAGLIAQWQGRTHLALVPLAASQQAIVAAAPDALRTILYRRQMMRIATVLGRRSGAKALVTGDSLGQVASQTLEHLATVEDAAGLPVLRPLVGTDKREIVDASRAAGLFEASTAPCQEACVLFEPKRPATKASIEECRQAEAGLDLDGLAAQAVEATEVRRLEFPPRNLAEIPGRATG